MPTELEALADKIAVAIATSILGALRTAAEASHAASKCAFAGSWLFHVLVGDGVSTNEAAARRVLAAAMGGPVGFAKRMTCFSA